MSDLERLFEAIADELSKQDLSHLPLNGDRLASAIRRALARLREGGD